MISFLVRGWCIDDLRDALWRWLYRSFSLEYFEAAWAKCAIQILCFFCTSVFFLPSNGHIIQRFIRLMLERLIEINGKTVKIDQVLDNSHAGTVWDGALVIIGYFGRQANQIQNIFMNKTILELGAGTGIVGLAITSFQPKRVILTDFKENLKILEHNKQKNHPAS